MLIVERQKRLLEMLRERGNAQLEDLSQALGVSVSTVRRDLDTMADRGVVERTHGGAVYRGTANGHADEPRSSRWALSVRMGERVQAKRAIGAAAAALVQPHMTLLMDGGSTVVFAAEQITARPLQIVTNSLSIANHFADDEQVELVLLGGSLYPRTEVTVGSITTGCMADLHADLLFFSLAGVYGDAAFNINLDMARVEQVMMQQAAESVLLMDASKFGRKSLVRVCGLGEVDRIITDDEIDAEWRDSLGDQLQVAGH